MHFATSALALVASAVAVAATCDASITFQTLDSYNRTIYFTPNPESYQMAPVTCSNQQETVVNMTGSWVGNYYAVREGDENVPGMLGEVNFDCEGQKTYFDVSAIVNPHDKNNIKEMWPAKKGFPRSGCGTFPCNNAYYLPDDVQTKVTEEMHIVTTLGANSSRTHL